MLLATCGGLGRIGCAPGTFGAAAGLLAAAGLAAAALPPLVEAGLLVAVNLLGIPICTRAVRLLGRGDDPGAIVYDEAASTLGSVGGHAVARRARGSVRAAPDF